jgi:hypothetical protein
MTPRKRTPEETLRAIEEQAAHDELERAMAMPAAEVDRELREAGFDPDGVAARGTALVERLLARRKEQAWQSGAQEKLARVRADLHARKAARGERLPRTELLERLERARADARLTQPVAVMFRNKRAEEATDEELEEMIEEIEALAARGQGGT